MYIMKRLHLLALRALRLCRQVPRTTRELADLLCICPRYAEQVVRFLRQHQLIVEAPAKGRRKFFQMAPEANYLPATLTTAEKTVMSGLLTNADPTVQTAIHKLLQSILP
jgi:hypothetical protein